MLVHKRDELVFTAFLFVYELVAFQLGAGWFLILDEFSNEHGL